MTDLWFYIGYLNNDTYVTLVAHRQSQSDYTRQEPVLFPYLHILLVLKNVVCFREIGSGMTLGVVWGTERKAGKTEDAWDKHFIIETDWVWSVRVRNGVTEGGRQGEKEGRGKKSFVFPGLLPSFSAPHHLNNRMCSPSPLSHQELALLTSCMTYWHRIPRGRWTDEWWRELEGHIDGDRKWDRGREGMFAVHCPVFLNPPDSGHAVVVVVNFVLTVCACSCQDT